MFKSLPTYFFAAALAALPAVSQAKSVSPDHANRQAAEILKDLDAKAADAAEQAGQIDVNIRSLDLGWEAFTSPLENLKGDVNDLGRDLSRLEEMRAALSPADREVIDHAGKIVKELAENTTASINAFNRDRENFWTPTWRQYAMNLVSESTQLSNSITHALDMDRTRAHEQQLEKELEAPVQ